MGAPVAAGDGDERGAEATAWQVEFPKPPGGDPVGGRCAHIAGSDNGNLWSAHIFIPMGDIPALYIFLIMALPNSEQDTFLAPAI